MSKKIVIVGALGYLGTELCKLYSGESWFNKVVAIDSRFVSERI
jgi:N-acetyl-gamma-glutamylphosphate reductase